jgi:hypothetical protein
MRALVLQFQTDLSQPFNRDLLSETLTADAVVLAIATPQRAAAEKNGAAAPAAADTGLFPEMQGRPGHFNRIVALAKSGLTGTVDPAHPRTQIAGAAGQKKFSFIVYLIHQVLLQLLFPEYTPINWLEHKQVHLFLNFTLQRQPI